MGLTHSLTTYLEVPLQAGPAPPPQLAQAFNDFFPLVHINARLQPMSLLFPVWNHTGPPPLFPGSRWIPLLRPPRRVGPAGRDPPHVDRCDETWEARRRRRRGHICLTHEICHPNEEGSQRGEICHDHMEVEILFCRGKWSSKGSLSASMITSGRVTCTFLPRRPPPYQETRQCRV